MTWSPKDILLLQATSNCHKIGLFGWNGIRPLFSPSLWPQVSGRVRLHGCTWNLILGILWKFVQQNLVRIGHFTWWPKYVLLLPATLTLSWPAGHINRPYDYFLVRWGRRGFPFSMLPSTVNLLYSVKTQCGLTVIHAAGLLLLPIKQPCFL